MTPEERSVLADAVAALRAVARQLAHAHRLTGEALAAGDVVLTQAEALLATVQVEPTTFGRDEIR